MSILNNILSILGGVIVGGGSLFAVFGLVQLGTALKDHQGPAIASACWNLAGAAAIILGGALCLSINFGA